MAHECINCGSECYCSGDIDDCVVSLTPPKCKGCGCADDEEFDNDDWEDDEVCACCGSDMGEYHWAGCIYATEENTIQLEP